MLNAPVGLFHCSDSKSSGIKVALMQASLAPPLFGIIWALRLPVDPPCAICFIIYHDSTVGSSIVDRCWTWKNSRNKISSRLFARKACLLELYFIENNCSIFNHQKWQQPCTNVATHRWVIQNPNNSKCNLITVDLLLLKLRKLFSSRGVALFINTKVESWYNIFYRF